MKHKGDVMNPKPVVFACDGQLGSGCAFRGIRSIRLISAARATLLSVAAASAAISVISTGPALTARCCGFRQRGYRGSWRCQKRSFRRSELFIAKSNKACFPDGMQDEEGVTAMKIGFSGLVVALLLVLAAPVLAQNNDGLDNDNDGQVDEDDEYDGGSNGNDRLETACMATSETQVCLAYFQFYCNYWGFQKSCAMAQLGSACNGGDPGQCQYFIGLNQANSACFFGDQNACNYLSQQPILQ